MDIIGLSEVKKSEDCLNLPSKHLLYYKGKDNESFDELGFLINKKLAGNINTKVSLQLIQVLIHCNI